VQILIADDHPVVRKGVRAILQSLTDLEVCIEANNGEDAVQKSLASNPDLVILDISMPILDGFGAAKKIQELQPNIPILMLSMYALPEVVRYTRTAGLQGFVTKSEVGDVLLKAVAILLRGGTFFMDDETKTGHLNARSLQAK
jgi:DNA-binding NarL/FixJ family response regulator